MSPAKNIALLAGVGAVRLPNSTGSPVFVSTAPTDHAVIARPEIAQPIVTATPQAVRPTLTAQIRDVKMLDPDFGSRISGIPFRPLGGGVERSALTAPILLGDTLAENSVLEDPRDPAKKFFVMGYAVGEEVATTGRQFIVRMAAKGPAWELSVTLAARAPAAILAANPGAQQLSHQVSLRLNYLQRVNNKPSVVSDIEFTQTTTEGGVVRGVLAIDNMNQRDELYQALTDPELEAHLIVRQLVTVAVRVPQAPVLTVPTEPVQLRFVQGEASLAVPARIRPIGDGEDFPDLPERPLPRPRPERPPRPEPEPPQPPPPPRYRETSRTLDLRLPFTFIKELHP